METIAFLAILGIAVAARLWATVEISRLQTSFSD